jgi:putative ABC transport system ATP-binding protein
MQIAPPQTDAARTAVVAAQAINAVKVYGKGDTAVRALDGIDVSFGKGQFSVIMGPSGSGKSTLMHCLAGLDTLSSGQILIGDTDLGTLDDKKLTQLRRDRVGFIFQAFNLVPTLTAEENIALPAALAGSKLDQPWVDLVVKTIGLQDRLQHRPNELSGGQQPRPPGPWPVSPRSSSPTSPPATWIRGRAPSCCHSCAVRYVSSARQS